jgi:hypothetical protein
MTTMKIIFADQSTLGAAVGRSDEVRVDDGPGESTAERGGGQTSTFVPSTFTPKLQAAIRRPDRRQARPMRERKSVDGTTDPRPDRAPTGGPCAGTLIELRGG